MRICTGVWAHRQRVSTFFTLKNSQILCVLLTQTGLEPCVFRSWVQRFTNWATPSPRTQDNRIVLDNRVTLVAMRGTLTGQLYQDKVLQPIHVPFFWVNWQVLCSNILLGLQWTFWPKGTLPSCPGPPYTLTWPLLNMPETSLVAEYKEDPPI